MKNFIENRKKNSTKLSRNIKAIKTAIIPFKEVQHNSLEIIHTALCNNHATNQHPPKITIFCAKKNCFLPNHSAKPIAGLLMNE